MVTAHVGGLAACIVSSKTFEGGPEEVRKRILDMALPDQILGIRAGKTRLANNGFGGSHVLPMYRHIASMNALNTPLLHFKRAHTRESTISRYILTISTPSE